MTNAIQRSIDLAIDEGTTDQAQGSGSVLFQW